MNFGLFHGTISFGISLFVVIQDHIVSHLGASRISFFSPCIPLCCFSGQHCISVLLLIYENWQLFAFVFNYSNLLNDALLYQKLTGNGMYTQNFQN